MAQKWLDEIVFFSTGLIAYFGSYAVTLAVPHSTFALNHPESEGLYIPRWSSRQDSPLAFRTEETLWDRVRKSPLDDWPTEPLSV
ncbi:hypothetical protein M441DRAFT_363794 [Trichoderma asperellum CBS 433.97]|uniref:Uncharacterized protein n=1 Tax=Trichoderma asperellum (strain ATCC 204424 / CBS 433.97 / NBRC 101777) TaxID=1042311 RepID=A0A2T3ZE20_TRIA4|nr:hypothetical protein M441DRAFT_363794 [Trichoderma asperellum CBS 433.97]PTB43034.1 hypothetical protein M441DRAFT_363794 [Trichoderma asperellum CBS 433.97]